MKPSRVLYGVSTTAIVYTAVAASFWLTGTPWLPAHINTLVAAALVGMFVWAAALSNRERLMAAHRDTRQHFDRMAAGLFGYVEGKHGEIHQHFDARHDALIKAMVEQSVLFGEVSGEIPFVATTTDVARVETAIQQSDRDRDQQVARLYDSLNEVRECAQRDLHAGMRYLLGRIDEKP